MNRFEFRKALPYTLCCCLHLNDEKIVEITRTKEKKITTK